jgi:hypothetical protein
MVYMIIHPLGSEFVDKKPKVRAMGKMESELGCPDRASIRKVPDV